jgi:Outer membrane efflux protein.
MEQREQSQASLNSAETRQNSTFRQIHIKQKMKRIFSTLLVLVCCLSSVDAQSLAECIETARANNIDVKVADLQVQRAKRMESSYFEMDRTELSLSQDPTSGGSPDNALTLSQKIDFPTVYGSRRKLLKAETQVEESRRQLTESELTRDVSVAYSQTALLAACRSAALRKRLRAGRICQDGRHPYKNGETNRLELMNAQQMKAENGIKLREAQDEKTAAQYSCSS